ncbi:MAG TPA: AbrB/MazE/SpoVT family DNA-binding domain-containing protein [Dehalococcoidia bacterium]|nr:AbrB/MazE/SpoVT family DNA-binding domain-containing protein [Dehalococcoidia bacterium]
MSGNVSEAPHAVTTQIGKRGVLVIPAAFRRWLGMEESASVRVEVRDGGLLIKPVREEISREEREAFLEAVGKAYDELRADPKRWAAFQDEFAEWDLLTGDPLPPEEWPELSET